MYVLGKNFRNYWGGGCSLFQHQALITTVRRLTKHEWAEGRCKRGLFFVSQTYFTNIFFSCSCSHFSGLTALCFSPYTINLNPHCKIVHNITHSPCLPGGLLLLKNHYNSIFSNLFISSWSPDTQCQCGYVILCVLREILVLSLLHNNIKLKKINFEEGHSMELTYAYERQGVWDADFILQLGVKVSERFKNSPFSSQYPKSGMQISQPLHGFPVCTISKFTYPNKCQNIDLQSVIEEKTSFVTVCDSFFQLKSFATL